MKLTVDERLELMRFMCWFAYADMRLDPEEFELIERMTMALELTEAQHAQVETWLEDPPVLSIEDVKKVPQKTRTLFLDALRLLGNADGDIDPKEQAFFARVAELWS